MYAGSNPTALQSQQWFREGMTALMLEESYSQITVWELCRKTDLSRQTFYNFFLDKEDVLRFCISQAYQAEFEKLADREQISIPDVLNAFFTIITENRQLLDAILRDHLDSILVDEVSKCVTLFADHFVRTEKDSEWYPYSKVMLSGALSQLLVYWMREGKRLSIEQMSDLITRFLEGNLYQITEGDPMEKRFNGK